MFQAKELRKMFQVESWKSFVVFHSMELEAYTMNFTRRVCLVFDGSFDIKP